MINSRFLDGMTIDEAKEEVARRLERETRGGRPVGERKVNFRLRDWGISRQRYWGCPIPVIHCDACGVVPVPGSRPAGRCCRRTSRFDMPGNPLDHHPTWKQVACPQCGAAARRETDTMDTFVDSSWYFARFTDPGAPTRRPTVRPSTLAAGRPVHRRRRARDPAPALFALLHPRHERRPATAGRRRAVRRPVHARHGRARDLPRAPTAPGSSPAEVRIESEGGDAPRVPRRARRRRSRSARSRRCRSRRGTPSTPTTSSRAYGADTARWFMLSDSPPERDVIWTEEGVQGAAPLRAARLAADRRDSPERWTATNGQRAGEGADEALAIRKAAHRALAAVERQHRARCASTLPSPISTSWPTPSQSRARGGRRRRATRASGFGLPRGGGDLRRSSSRR